MTTMLAPTASSGAITRGVGGRRAVALWLPAAAVALAVILAVIGPWIAPHDPNAQDVLNRLAEPSARHWLGTDDLGRDVLSRILAAFRTDIPLGFAGAFLPFLLGTLIGSSAAYIGGVVDQLAVRLADLIIAFPVYVLAISLVTVTGFGPKTLLLAFTCVGWVPYARISRAAVLRLKKADFVAAARLGGLSHRQVLTRHVLPNSLRMSIAFLATDIMFVLLALSAFSYLGLGIQPPTADWGAMIAQAQPYMQQQWWLVAAPGLVIALVGLAFVLLGEALNDRNE